MRYTYATSAACTHSGAVMIHQDQSTAPVILSATKPNVSCTNIGTAGTPCKPGSLAPQLAGRWRYRRRAVVPLDWIPHEPAGMCRVQLASTSRRGRGASRIGTRGIKSFHRTQCCPSLHELPTPTLSNLMIRFQRGLPRRQPRDPTQQCIQRYVVALAPVLVVPGCCCGPAN